MKKSLNEMEEYFKDAEKLLEEMKYEVQDALQNVKDLNKKISEVKWRYCLRTKKPWYKRLFSRRDDK